MDKERLELYADYLISNFVQVTAAGLSRLPDGKINHARGADLCLTLSSVGRITSNCSRLMSLGYTVLAMLPAPYHWLNQLLMHRQ